jgi:xanthine/uracil permease
MLRRDAAAAAMWAIIIVPGAFGFWIVAGDMVGVPAADQRTFVVSALLAMAVMTLFQVVAGCRMPVFEGPASTYLSALAIVATAAGGVSLASITGGLLVGGAVVLTIGVLQIHRPLERWFTSFIGAVFLIIVCLMVLPDGFDRAIGRSDDAPLGTHEAWLTSAIVMLLAGLGRRIPAFRPFSLFAAMVLGGATYFALAGFPDVDFDWSVTAPPVMPWGAPEFEASVIVPFVVAALLVALNAIASVRVSAMSRGEEPDPVDSRRALVVHGVTQMGGASFGNVLGNVPRLDSVAIVEMVDNPRRSALALAAVSVILLACWGPFVTVVALVPVPLSAALLVMILGLLVISGMREVLTRGRRGVVLVLVCAVAPTLVWLVVRNDLSEQAQLVANPLLLGIVAAIVLEQRYARPSVQNF